MLKDKKKSVTILDCDDVLLDLNEEVYTSLGLSYPRSYFYRTSGQYSPSEVEKITKSYGDPEVFRRARFVDGADEILELELYGTEVRICTRSFNKDVEDVKRIILPEHTHVSPDKIDFQLGTGYDKRYPDDADIVVDDCISNILGLSKGVIRILIDKSYNQEPLSFDLNNQIYRFLTLKDALVFIRHLHISGLIWSKEWRRKSTYSSLFERFASYDGDYVPKEWNTGPAVDHEILD